MKTEFLKKFVVIIFILALALSSSYEVLAKITNTAKDATQSFGISLLHTSKNLKTSSNLNFAYRLDTRNTYRIYAGNNDYETTIICLNKNGKFPTEESSTGNYKSLGTATATTLSSAYSAIDSNRSKQILWLIDNAVLPEDSDELKNIKLAKIFESLISSTSSTENPLSLDDIKNYLTEDDLVFAYQCAVWQATNYSNVSNADNAEILQLVFQGSNDGTNWDGLTGNDRWGYKGRKGTYIKQIISFYINHYNGSENIVPTASTTAVKPAITKPTTTSYEKSGSKIFVGPFKIDTSETGKSTYDYTVGITFKDGSGNKLNLSMNNADYLLTTTASTSTTLLKQTKASLEGKEFYIALPLNTKVRTIDIQLNTATIKTTSTGTVWQAVSGNNMQPLLSISRTEEPGENVSATYSFNVTATTNYDVALRKYIAIVYRENSSGNWNIVYDGRNNGRVPTVHKSTGTDPFNQYEYYHQKDPVEVQVGDRVVYGITLYNEGTDTVRITNVIDHLPPSGLEFIRTSSNLAYSAAVNAQCTPLGNNIAYTDSNQGYITELDGVSGSTVHSKTFYMEFQVTEDAVGKVVTNIAEITGMADTSGNALGYDIDSAPNNAQLPTAEDDWEHYEGNDNKSELTDTNYYYKGQEDDDDFEKITVKEDKKMDLALRKSIKTVNGTAPAKTRAKDPDTSPLTDNDDTTTTSIFSDEKGSLPVSVGDIVIYTIRIFNEGDADGYASQITDYIPEGLGFIVNHNINYKNQWTPQGSPTTVKLSTIPNATSHLSTSDFSDSGRVSSQDDVKNIDVVTGKATLTTNKLSNDLLKAFDKTNNSLDIHEVQIACVVLDGADETTLRNIAAITEYKDKNKNLVNPDIDSYYNNDLSNFDENNHEDDEDYEKLKLSNKVYDLALKKYVSGLKDATNNTKQIANGEKRNLQVTNIDALTRRISATEKADATYSFGLDKERVPVQVEKGDSVIYTIRVYNEGLTDAKVGELIDTVPEGLSFIPASSSSINSKYGWEGFSNRTNGWTSGIRTDYLANTTISAFDSSKINTSSYDSATGTGIDKGVSYAEVKIEFKVTTSENKALKNIAEITNDDGDDNDSTPNNKDPNEDDEDFDVVIPITYDLALKKYVSSLTDATNTTKKIPDDQKRELKVTDVTALENRGTNSDKADATYSFGINKSSNPVRVEQGDNVVYTIRVYNEGLIDAKVGELIDTVPEELTFLPDSSINKKYGWEEFKDETNGGWTEGIKTTYLSNTTLQAFDSSKKGQTSYSEATGIGIDNGVSYAEVKIEFKVATSESKVLRNIAEITKDDGDDNDSTPDNKDTSEDDEDFDVIIPTRFDLSLRKFITKIDDKDVTDRVPEVNTKELDDETSTTATYTHTKEPKIVVNGQTVIYTIRVYNEGTINGYAAEIKDDIPEGLTYLPDNEINQIYRWKIYDENGNQTDDVSKAVTVRTDYGAKKNETIQTAIPSDYTKAKYPYYKASSNMLLAYDKETMTDGPDYIDVQVAFKVTKDNVTDGNSIIINTAEVSKDTDETGNEVTDIDSTPDNDKDSEDDIDKEYLKLNYFDLSLLKYVSKVIVTEDGVTKETETGFNGTENPEPVVKVEINKKKIAKTQVKYVYSIKITNEGEIEGYAKEVTDRIPTGLAFYEEDNKEYGWKVSTEGVVTTDYLKDTLLKPGESAIVQIVLRWENSETNLGQKINVAEISKDENEYGIPDIDSTPNNNKDGEDDQDEAIVVLSITTGSTPVYIALITTIIAILVAGFYLIYKYVVKK